jgi:hypothetical protein
MPARQEMQDERDRRVGAPQTCSRCGSHLQEMGLTRPWGASFTRLLICPDPQCGKVAAEDERRLPWQGRSEASVEP